MSCAIAGVFGREDEATVRAMLQVMAHRGPDDTRVVSGPGFTLGANRLAIMDPKHGAQPVSDESGQIWAVLNGEIYNYQILRYFLVGRGHTFKTSCDTELLPHLWEENLDSLKLTCLDGMFALALWDSQKQQGLLLRDRMGKKPLYYFKDDSLWFASEPLALLKVPGFHKKLNKKALWLYLAYRHVPCPMSIYTGIAQLPPGQQIVFGGSPVVATEDLDRALQSAVVKRLRADVPLGFFLSGGLDSSLVLAIARKFYFGQAPTFTVVYPPPWETEGKARDRELARKVAALYGTDHHEVELTPEKLWEALPSILRAFGEPFAGVITPYFLAQEAAKSVKVVLTGDGADELFGSYLSHREAAQAPQASLRAQVAHLKHLRYSLLDFSDDELVKMASFRGATSVYDHLRGYFRKLTARGPVNMMLEAEFRGFFPDQVLAFVDRLSMAHGLEVRCPYLDRDFVDLAASIPGKRKIQHGQTKLALKELARRYLPPEVVDRPKEGFIAPVEEWLRGPLLDRVLSALSPDRLERHGLFRPEMVAGILQRMQADDVRATRQARNLLMFQLWWEEVW